MSAYLLENLTRLQKAKDSDFDAAQSSLRSVAVATPSGRGAEEIISQFSAQQHLDHLRRSEIKAYKEALYFEQLQTKRLAQSVASPKPVNPNSRRVTQALEQTVAQLQNEQLAQLQAENTRLRAQLGEMIANGACSRPQADEVDGALHKKDDEIETLRMELGLANAALLQERQTAAARERQMRFLQEELQEQTETVRRLLAR